MGRLSATGKESVEHSRDSDMGGITNYEGSSKVSAEVMLFDFILIVWTLNI